MKKEGNKEVKTKKIAEDPQIIVAKQEGHLVEEEVVVDVVEDVWAAVFGLVGADIWVAVLG